MSTFIENYLFPCFSKSDSWGVVSFRVSSILIETKIKLVSLAHSIAELKLFISATLAPATANICKQHFVEREINNIFCNHIFFFHGIWFSSREQSHEMFLYYSLN